jgi:tRNA(Met) cytidine acetyltransferase
MSVVNSPTRPSAHSPRRTLVLAGDAHWGRQTAAELLWPDALWIGDAAPAGVRVLPAAQAQQALGADLIMLVFDAHAGLDPDALGAVTGTLRGGGVLVLLTPPLDQWPACDDPDKTRYASHPHGRDAVAGRFLARLAQLLATAPGVQLIAEGQRVELPVAAPEPLLRCVDDPDCLSQEQAAAVAAILRVAHGHRRRPLVLSADRGRGKSAALGIAAARLLRDGMAHIVVTAPRPAAVAALFAQAERLLPAAERHGNRLALNGGCLTFVAADALLRQPPAADLVLVDEAAAIPVPLLARLLARHARIVFAGTVHGYEGSGRGFALRFRAELGARTPQWRGLQLATPIRYGPDDPLEAWVNQALLLDAEPAPNEVMADADPASLQIVRIEQAALAADAALLRQTFGLLVQAHYQTRPADLRQLLDAPDLTLWLARAGDQVAGVCLVQAEGGLDATLAAQVAVGQRRPHGHLVPQALAQQFGLPALAQQRTARVMRIAVHPALQRRGLGARLLAAVAEQARADGCDWWGASFAADPASLAFWQSTGCDALRLGLSRDAASGSHSAILLAALSATAQGCVGVLRRRFVDTLAHGLADSWRELEPAVAAGLLHCARPSPALSDQDRAELGDFAAGRRELATSQLALWRLACQVFAGEAVLPQDYALLVRRVLQRWPDAEVVAEAGLSGRRELQDRLRGMVAGLMSETLS